MGSGKNTVGKRVFDDKYEFPQDTQSLADDIWDAYVTRAGTSSERGLIPPGELRDGIVFRETDTGYIYLRQGGAWLMVGGVTPFALMRRTGTVLTAAAGDYRNLSANAAWTSTGGLLRGGMTYSNGIVVPVGGTYEIFWTMRAANDTPTSIAGISINKDTGVGADDFWALGHMLYSTLTIGSSSARVRLNANDKLTLFGYIGSGTLTVIPSASGTQGTQWGARWVAP